MAKTKIQKKAKQRYRGYSKRELWRMQLQVRQRIEERRRREEEAEGTVATSQVDNTAFNV